jgi:hypothetical protein
MAAAAAQPAVQPVRARRVLVDVVFGIFAPLACLIFDPAVFHLRMGIPLNSPLLGPWRVFFYVAIPLAVASLSVWYIFRSRAGYLLPFLAGIFVAGGVVSFLLGVALLPFSLLGLTYNGIGVFGFIPFITSYVYLRNYQPALRAAAPYDWKIVLFPLGIAFAIVLPGLVWRQAANFVEAPLAQVADADESVRGAALGTLKMAFWCDVDCYLPLITRYQREKDAARKQRIAAAYQALTGRDIERALLDWD